MLQVIVYLLIAHGKRLHAHLLDGAGQRLTVDDFASVQSFEPVSGPPAHANTNTAVTITVRNRLAAVAPEYVTVAGRECESPVAMAVDADQHGGGSVVVTRITCTVAAVSWSQRPDVGPVQVTFVNPTTAERTTVRSWPQTFRFVSDTGAAVPGNTTQPFQGIVSGGTAVPGTEMQRFQGIVSGGTAVPVRGARLSSATNVTMYVNQTEGTGRRAGCQLLDDTHMVCRSPALDDGGVLGGACSLPFGFLVVDSGTERALRLAGPMPAAYLLYPDPVLVDFETLDDVHAVAINGRDLHRGYGIDDVTVRFRDREGRCDVVYVAADRIVCRATGPARLDGLRDIVVSVGDAFQRNVTRREPEPEPSRPTVLRDLVVVVVGMFLLVCIVSVLFGQCFDANDQFRFTRMMDNK